jgi:hypothetical protein
MKHIVALVLATLSVVAGGAQSAPLSPNDQAVADFRLLLSHQVPAIQKKMDTEGASHTAGENACAQTFLAKYTAEANATYPTTMANLTQWINQQVADLKACVADLKTDKGKQPEVTHTGTVRSWHMTGGTSASITVNGHTATSYCTSDDTSVDCSDISGGFIVTFDDGSTTELGTPLDAGIDGYSYSKCDNPSVCNPVLGSISENGTGTFQYRVIIGRSAIGKIPFYCVDFTVTDKHGKEKPQTSCYPIYTATSANGTSLFPNKDGFLAPLDRSNPYHTKGAVPQRGLGLPAGQ